MSPANPICSPLASPAPVSPEEAFVVPLAIDAAAADRAAKDAILESFWRPEDISQASIDPAALVFLPFWRASVSVDGFHLGLTHTTKQDGSIGWVLPTGGARHRDADLLVTARRNFPFLPVLMQAPGLLGSDRGVPMFRAFAIEAAEFVPRASHPIKEGEIVDPDVTREAAEREAKDRILRAVMPSSALYAKYEPKVRAMALVHYPLYIVRYDYEGHARKNPGEAFHVIVSGKTGKIVGARHPSAVRALARKFRKLMTLG